MKHGQLVIIEGTDCSGKSTLAEILADDLTEVYTKYKVLRFHEPYLQLPNVKNNTARILLQMAQRVELYKEEIEKYLEQGYIVIVDRSFVSTYIYNCKNPEDYKLTADLVKRCIDEDMLRKAFWIFVTPTNIRLANNMIQRAKASRLEEDEEDYGANIIRNEAYLDTYYELKNSEYPHVYNVIDTTIDEYNKIAEAIIKEIDKHEK